MILLSNKLITYAIRMSFEIQRERERERAVSYTHLDVYKRQVTNKDASVSTHQCNVPAGISPNANSI